MNEALLQAISSDEPTGIDFKYEDRFLELEQEIDKDTSASAENNTDWSLVISECESILGEFTKDIKLLSWWIFGLWTRDGIKSLPTAISTMGTLIGTYKTAIFPKSPRAKNNVLTSLETFLTDKLLDEKNHLSNFHQLPELLESFELLSTSIKEGLESEEVFFRKIKEALSRLIKEKEAEAALKEKKAKAAAESGEITNVSDANKVLSPLKKNVQSLIDFWRTEDASDMRALKMTRLLSWMDIDAIPESDGGKIGMNGPSFEGMESIEALEAQGNFSEALILCESLMNYAPFWIDGHVKSYELLIAMEATQSADYVLHTLVSFVQSFKGIVDLSYADGVPFASLASKSVINEAMPSGGSGSSEDDALVIAKDAAQGFLKKSKTKEGLQYIEEAYNSAKNEEERFEMRLLHAELALDSGQQDAAQALLDDLVEKVETFKVDVWKPELAAKVFGMYLNHFNRTQIDHEAYESMYRKLCKIDIAGAMSIH
ncbi:type VI secretion system domain-containing protein [Sulfurimonas sp. MAG313]|nr:TssA family type VI secretion system protein [Sulfurimonas sp. MAG313]MDF1880601.1 type VI secretion system domain-containing protein [Sulfurimonas sp. MAG313]